MSMVQAPSLKEDDFFKIMFKHVPTRKMVNFEGWVTSFSDQFTSNWSSQNVYGRMDPLVAFEGTQRVISMDFDIVSANFNDAKINLAAIAELIKFQYPMYNQSSRAAQNTLKAAPLIQIRWTNLLSNATDGQLLTGYMNGVSYAPDVNEGGFLMTGDVSSQGIVSVGKDADPRRGKPISNPELFAETVAAAEGTDVNVSSITNNNAPSNKKMYVPKKVSLSITFNVLHTHLTGWHRNLYGNKDVDASFPNTTLRNKEATLAQATATVSVNEEGQQVVDTTTSLEKSFEADVLLSMAGRNS